MLPHQRGTILQSKGIYGVGDRVLLPRLLRLVKGNRIIGVGDLRVPTSLTHSANLSLALEQVLQKPVGAGVTVYKVADREPYLLRQVMQKVTEKLTQKQLALLPLPTGLVWPLSFLL